MREAEIAIYRAVIAHYGMQERIALLLAPFQQSAIVSEVSMSWFKASKKASDENSQRGWRSHLDV
jgi:hypothetical protein